MVVWDRCNAVCFWASTIYARGDQGRALKNQGRVRECTGPTDAVTIAFEQGGDVFYILSGSAPLLDPLLPPEVLQESLPPPALPVILDHARLGAMDPPSSSSRSQANGKGHSGGERRFMFGATTFESVPEDSEEWAAGGLSVGELRSTAQ